MKRSRKLRLSTDRFDDSTVYADLPAGGELSEAERNKALAFARKHRAHNVEVYRFDVMQQHADGLRFVTRLTIEEKG